MNVPSGNTPLGKTQYSGPGSHFHEIDQDNVTWDASHRLLQQASRGGSQNTVGRNNFASVGDEGHRPHSTSLPDSSRLSVLSYDSLEESTERSVDHDADQSPAATKPGSQHRSRYCGWLPTSIWSLEILNCVIASLCLAAIVGIVSTYHGLPLPQWSFNITINALISVFTAIFKIALTMPIAEGISQFKWLWFNQPRELADIERLDRASRGAWGSFLLLLSRLPRLTAIWLANLGAIITIAALAIDPFSQQIIQTGPCLRNITGSTGGIPKTQNLEGIIASESLKPRLTGSMQAAIYLGLLSPPANSSAAVTADCRTGNCTFPHDNGAAFSTLAICHSCVNISDTIIYGKTDSEVPDERPASIPSGAQIDGYNTMLASMGTSDSYSESMFSFEALMSLGDINDPHDLAISCSMNPCMKTFSANVTDNVYQETELSSSDLVWSYHAGYTLATNETLRNGTWQSCLPTPQNTSTNTLRINTTSMALISTIVEPVGVEQAVSSEIDLQNISADASLWYPADCVWWFGILPAEGVSNYLEDLFDDQNLTTPYWSRDPSSGIGDLWLVNLYRNGTANMDTINTYMDGLAWSMTANMRQTSEDSIPLRVVSGQMQRVESCLTVRWVWLSLPASLLALEFAFLASIMVYSRSTKHWHGDWKDSPLALLYHGLESAKDRDVVGDKLLHKDGMYKVAQETKVQLRKRDGNWRFCEET